MLTPFTIKDEVDFTALDKMIDWYVSSGVSGLFAVCQSSEMFFLSLDERVKLARHIKERAQVPVIASGHVSNEPSCQIDELCAIAETGVDALILVVNRLATKDESDEVLTGRLRVLMKKLPSEMPLGIYECPYPYKRLLSPALVRKIAQSDRFFFYKDTCGEIEQIRAKLDAMRGTNLKMYNANTATLVMSLENGAAGYSGVMANFHPELYAWLCDNYQSDEAQKVSDVLTLCALIERQLYPINAKFSMKCNGLDLEITSRANDQKEFIPLFAEETLALIRTTKQIKKLIKMEETS